MKKTMFLAAAVLLLGATAWADMQPSMAKATLKDATGKTVGEATLKQTPHGVLITVDFSGMPAGEHALHIHQTGKCEPPFTSAGGHFNPTGHQHGILNPKGMHAGDLPNIYVPDSGSLKVDVFAAGVTLGKGKNSLFDKDGSALVIHAGADDYKSDPAGDAGARIACGVITK
jgi:superoxide dismutase, Cu-Zn family